MTPDKALPIRKKKKKPKPDASYLRRLRAGEPHEPTGDAFFDDFLRDDAGTPLGVSGRPLREDGDTHREGWQRIVRADPCSYCGRPGGTVDHIEPKSKKVRGLGGAHSWMNYTGACETCNGTKRQRDLMSYLIVRAKQRPTRRARPYSPKPTEEAA